VRLRLVVAALALLSLGGCGGGGDGDAGHDVTATAASAERDPEAVLRAWIQAVNEDDNVRAASYFAPNAVEINPEGERTPIPDRATAIALNSNLLCSAQIQSVNTNGDTATSVLRLGKRRSNPRTCGADVGRRLPVRITIRKGKITRLTLGP
jgi:hypothetical protein